MELASKPAIPEPPIAVIGQLSENWRLGFRPAESTLFQGAMPVKYLNGIRDSSSVASNSWQMSLMAQETNAAVVTAAPVTMEQIDAVVKPLVDSAVGALETAVEKTVTLSVETVVGVVGFVFASEQKTGEVTPPPMVPELVPSHAPTQPNPSAASEHTKNKQNKNKDRHEKNRPGRPTTKDRQKPGFKPRTPPRPQDRED